MLGQSTVVGTGGDSVIGLCFVEVFKMFEADFETEAVGVIGEIGGMLKRGWQPAYATKVHRSLW
jgi:succinyl-CoA synthetase alpha subunit